MIKVQIAQLKNGLSLYLRKVREGTEILITDREKPIARIVPLTRTQEASSIEILQRLQVENFLQINFSDKTRGKKIHRVQLSAGPTTTEMIQQDRNR